MSYGINIKQNGVAVNEYVTKYIINRLTRIL